MANMAQGRHSMPRHTKWLIAALLTLVMSLALSAQLPSTDVNADDYGLVLVAPEGMEDEAGRAFDGDASFDALLICIALAGAALKSSFSTTRYLSASYLVSFISAPPRAPPVVVH